MAWNICGLRRSGFSVSAGNKSNRQIRVRSEPSIAATSAACIITHSVTHFESFAEWETGLNGRYQTVLSLLCREDKLPILEHLIDSQAGAGGSCSPLQPRMNLPRPKFTLQELIHPRRCTCPRWKYPVDILYLYIYLPLAKARP